VDLKKIRNFFILSLGLTKDGQHTICGVCGGGSISTSSECDSADLGGGR